MKSVKIQTIVALAIASFIAVSAVGCSSNPKPAMKAPEQTRATLRTAALESVAAKPVARPEPAPASLPDAKPKPKALTFRSRDYAVSFEYPWQYAYFSARTIANGDEGLKPKPDGNDGQFTLARVEVPKGFYPDTDFESGYFTLSLNQNLADNECGSSLNGSVQTRTINGVDFRWAENDVLGGGKSEKVRSYMAFTNGTCYEIELGVKTRNDGLAREIDPEQVMRRLEGILSTVEILPATRAVKTVETAAGEQD